MNSLEVKFCKALNNDPRFKDFIRSNRHPMLFECSNAINQFYDLWYGYIPFLIRKGMADELYIRLNKR